MDCFKFVELMSDFAEGELSAKDTVLWQQHFDECKNCAPFFKSFQSSCDLMKYLKEKKCPEQVKLRVENLISEMCEKKQQKA